MRIRVTEADCAEDSSNEIFQKERAHEASAILRKVKVR
jgi:hypothetical protein